MLGDPLAEARDTCGLRPSREITAAEADALIRADRRQRPAAAPARSAAAAPASAGEAAFLRGLMQAAGAPADREPVALATRGPWIARPIIEPAPLPLAERLRLPLRVRAALWYAAVMAWPVFPVRPDKKPYTSHGYLDASLEPRQILEWWRRWPDALVAMPTGCATGVVVVDVDCKREGVDGFEALEAAGVRLPATWAVRTRSGGAHLYFQAPRFPAAPLRSGANIRLFGRELPGVDLRADGGYVVVPAGRDGYRWSRLRPGRSVLAAMPTPLLAGLHWREPERPAPVYALRPAAGGGGFERVLDDCCRAITAAAPGGRQETLSARAWQAGRLVGEGKLDAGSALQRVLEAAAAIGGPDWDKRAALATARRRFEAGARGDA